MASSRCEKENPFNGRQVHRARGSRLAVEPRLRKPVRRNGGPGNHRRQCLSPVGSTTPRNPSAILKVGIGPIPSMANLREESLNSYLALLLDEYEGIDVAAERRSPGEAIDITVMHVGAAAPVPILIEAKIGSTPAKRREAVKQARARLTSEPRALAFGLCYPIGLRSVSQSARAARDALRESTLAFASIQSFGRDPTWREGTVADLADSLRNADLSRQRVAFAVERCVREAAEEFFQAGCGPELASALALPKTSKDLRAATLVASLMLSNAALLHHRLRLVPTLAEIAPLEEALREPRHAPALIRDAWRAILAVDYHPVFAPALAALSALADSCAREPIRRIAENAVLLADELASLRFDHAGSLYHRLLESARFDGSFYTHNVSALLLARLALTEELADWSNADELARLKVIDPACGTGTLLMGAMHAIRDRHERAAGSGADSDLLHLALVEDVLYGLDINRHGVQLAACNLTLGNPRVDYRRMNLFTMQHGPQPNGISKAGSLEFLATAKNRRDIASLSVPLPSAGSLDAERAEPGAVPDKSLTGQFDLVIMNPPFTRNDIRNRQYGRDERQALQEREIEIARFLQDRDPSAYHAIDQTSVQTFFTPLADVFLKDKDASLATVVPTTVLSGAAAALQRTFLAERFQIDSVVTSHDPKRMNFSENTTIHESLLVARRPGPTRNPTRFVSLARMPRDAHEAILLADLINRRQPLGKWGTEHSWPWPRIREGDWSAAQFYDGRLADAMHDLAALAGTRLAPAGEQCHIEPGGQRVRDAFLRESSEDAGWTAPVLWDHITNRQTTMNGIADVQAAPKPDREPYARFLTEKASRLLVVNRLRTDTVRVTACRATEPLLGSAWIPVRPIKPDSAYERALCAWWNSTPGVLTLLHSRAKALDYTRYALDVLRSLLVPDLDQVDIRPLDEAFNECRSSTLRPWPEMHLCPTRAILDRAAAQVLRIDGRTIADWRERIAREPTVSKLPAFTAT